MAFLNASNALVGSMSVTAGAVVKSIVFVFSIMSRATDVHGRSRSAWNTSNDVTNDIIAGTISTKSDTKVRGCQASNCNKRNYIKIYKSMCI